MQVASAERDVQLARVRMAQQERACADEVQCARRLVAALTAVLDQVAPGMASSVVAKHSSAATAVHAHEHGALHQSATEDPVRWPQHAFGRASTQASTGEEVPSVEGETRPAVAQRAHASFQDVMTSMRGLNTQLQEHGLPSSRADAHATQVRLGSSPPTLPASPHAGSRSTTQHHEALPATPEVRAAAAQYSQQNDAQTPDLATGRALQHGQTLKGAANDVHTPAFAAALALHANTVRPATGGPAQTPAFATALALRASTAAPAQQAQGRASESAYHPLRTSQSVQQRARQQESYVAQLQRRQELQEQLQQQRKHEQALQRQQAVRQSQQEPLQPQSARAADDRVRSSAFAVDTSANRRSADGALLRAMTPAGAAHPQSPALAVFSAGNPGLGAGGMMSPASPGGHVHVSAMTQRSATEGATSQDSMSSHGSEAVVACAAIGTRCAAADSRHSRHSDAALRPHDSSHFSASMSPVRKEASEGAACDDCPSHREAQGEPFTWHAMQRQQQQGGREVRPESLHLQAPPPQRAVSPALIELSSFAADALPGAAAPGHVVSDSCRDAPQPGAASHDVHKGRPECGDAADTAVQPQAACDRQSSVAGSLQQAENGAPMPARPRSASLARLKARMRSRTMQRQHSADSCQTASVFSGGHTVPTAAYSAKHVGAAADAALVQAQGDAGAPQHTLVGPCAGPEDQTVVVAGDVTDGGAIAPGTLAVPDACAAARQPSVMQWLHSAHLATAQQQENASAAAAPASVDGRRAAQGASQRDASDAHTASVGGDVSFAPQHGNAPASPRAADQAGSGCHADDDACLPSSEAAGCSAGQSWSLHVDTAHTCIGEEKSPDLISFTPEKRPERACNRHGALQDAHVTEHADENAVVKVRVAIDAGEGARVVDSQSTKHLRASLGALARMPLEDLMSECCSPMSLV